MESLEYIVNRHYYRRSLNIGLIKDSSSHVYVHGVLSDVTVEDECVYSTWPRNVTNTGRKSKSPSVLLRVFTRRHIANPITLRN